MSTSGLESGDLENLFKMAHRFRRARELVPQNSAFRNLEALALTGGLKTGALHASATTEIVERLLCALSLDPQNKEVLLNLKNSTAS